MSSNRRRGLLFIVSAPSGTGKTTLVERLVQMLPNLRMSRSYTSRAGARTASVTASTIISSAATTFEQRIDALRVPRVGRRLRQLLRHGARPTSSGSSQDGQDVVLVIDVQGARQVKARGVDHTAIFVLPPSFEVLEQRLRGRSKDTEEQMQRRLATARAEAVELSSTTITSWSTTSSSRRSCGCRRSSPPSGRARTA